MYKLSCDHVCTSLRQVQVRFLRHEGYLGAIGAFLCQGVEGFKTEEYCWLENLYGSSGFTGPKKDDGEGTASYLDLKQLEIDRFEKKLRFCPLLLDPQKYVADTVDLVWFSQYDCCFVFISEIWIKLFLGIYVKFWNVE